MFTATFLVLLYSYLSAFSCASPALPVARPLPSLQSLNFTSLTYDPKIFCQEPGQPILSPQVDDCQLAVTEFPHDKRITVFATNQPNPDYRIPIRRKKGRCHAKIGLKRGYEGEYDSSNWPELRHALMTVVERCLIEKQVLGFARVGSFGLLEAGIFYL